MNSMTTDTAPALTPASVAAMSNTALNTMLATLCGWTIVDDGADNGGTVGIDPATGETEYVPDYCTDPVAAESALKAIEARGCDWALSSSLYAGSDGEVYRVYVTRIFEPKPQNSKDGILAEVDYKPTSERAVAECATLALAAMKEGR